MADVRVDLLNLDSGFVLLSTGEIFSITNRFNADGEPAEGGDEITAVVGRMADGNWMTIDMRMLDRIEPN